MAMVRRLLASIACLLMLYGTAYAQQTKSALNTEINTNWPDNTTGLITPALLRSTVIDIVNSYQDLNGTSAFNCAVHNWISAFASLSVPSCTQPNFSDLNGNIASNQINNGTNANNTTFLRGDMTWVTPSGSGTVTEQKNTAGVGLSTSGNCDNTSTNAGSPCQYALAMSNAANSLSGNVAMNNISNYFTGPSVAQGTSGTWYASGQVTVEDTSTVALFYCKLWDGTTVIDSAASATGGANFRLSIHLSGILSSPAANIRISCRDTSSTNGSMLFNETGNSKDSTLTVMRIQ